jgi:RNA polymerase II subunit A small phosphatase-like protein
VIVPPTPSRASHTLPIEETQGLTAGAVVPPGATADDYHQHAAVGADDGNSEGTSFTDDEFHDAPEEDMEAEEARLVANGGFRVFRLGQ